MINHVWSLITLWMINDQSWTIDDQIYSYSMIVRSCCLKKENSVLNEMSNGIQTTLNRLLPAYSPVLSKNNLVIYLIGKGNNLLRQSLTGQLATWKVVQLPIKQKQHQHWHKYIVVVVVDNWTWKQLMLKLWNNKNCRMCQALGVCQSHEHQKQESHYPSLRAIIFSGIAMSRPSLSAKIFSPNFLSSGVWLLWSQSTDIMIENIWAGQGGYHIISYHIISYHIILYVLI